LDSGYSLSRTKLEISNEDLLAYETSNIEEGIKYALGFFDESIEKIKDLGVMCLFKPITPILIIP
jgi:hypothetical protein